MGGRNKEVAARAAVPKGVAARAAVLAEVGEEAEETVQPGVEAATATTEGRGSSSSRIALCRRGGERGGVSVGRFPRHEGCRETVDDVGL